MTDVLPALREQEVARAEQSQTGAPAVIAVAPARGRRAGRDARDDELVQAARGLGNGAAGRLAAAREPAVGLPPLPAPAAGGAEQGLGPLAAAREPPVALPLSSVAPVAEGEGRLATPAGLVPPDAVQTALRSAEEAATSTEPEYARSLDLGVQLEVEPPPLPSDEYAIDVGEAAGEMEEAAAVVEEVPAPGKDEAEPSVEEELELPARSEPSGGAPPAEGGLASAAGQAGAVLASSAAAASTLMGARVKFSPRPEERSTERHMVLSGAQLRLASDSMATAFVSRNASHVAALVATGLTAAPRLLSASAEAKASVDQAVADNDALVRARLAELRAEVKAKAASAIGTIGGTRDAVIERIGQKATETQAKIEAEHKLVADELDRSETTQLEAISATYATWDGRYRQTGKDVGAEAKGIGRNYADDWLAQRNGESSILDGPIHDNRLEAKADAAIAVAEKYETGLAEEGCNQADAVAEGEATVLEAVSQAAGDARLALGEHLSTMKTSLEQSTKASVDQVKNTAASLIRAVTSARDTTLADLTNQEELQCQRLLDYGERQKGAIDRDAGAAVGSLVAGVAEASTAFQTAILGFVDEAASVEAPGGRALAPLLAGAQGEVDGMAAGLVQGTAAGIDSSVAAALGAAGQAAEALNQLGFSAGEQAAAAVAGFTTSVTETVKTATAGLANLEASYSTTAQKVVTDATGGFAQTKTALSETFGVLSTNADKNLSDSRDALRDGLRGSFGELRSTIETEAQKAADAVQPRWKKVLKAALIVTVVIASIVLTVVTAGAGGVIGTILIGVAVGAAAGATIQIGSNLIDGKEWSDGVVKAAVVGGISGLFGGVGGALAKGVVGAGLKIGIEVGADVVGGVVGDLAVGNPITLEGVLLGAAIGAGAGGAIGGVAALKQLRNKIKLGGAGAGGPTPSVTPTARPTVDVTAPRPTADVTAPAGPRPPPEVPAPSRPTTPEAPPARRPAPEPEAPRRPTPEPEAPVRPAPEPEAPRRPAAEEPAAGPPRPDAEVEPVPKRPDANQPEPGVREKVVSDDGLHEIKVTENGKIVRCSLTCGEMREVFADVLKDRPGLRDRLAAIEKRAGKPGAAEEAKDLEAQLRRIQETGGEVELGGVKFAGKEGREEIEKHLDAIVKAGEPMSAADRTRLQKLAKEFGDEVNTGKVSDEMKQRLESALREFSPQHVENNPILKEAWQRTLAKSAKDPEWQKYLNPDGSLRPEVASMPPAVRDPDLKELYDEARSRFSKTVGEVTGELDDAFGELRTRVSGLPQNVQLHHLLYKAHFPLEAVNPKNLVLALRKTGTADELHDLLHFLSAGGNITQYGSNRWRTLLDQMAATIRKVYGL